MRNIPNDLGVKTAVGVEFRPEEAVELDVLVEYLARTNLGRSNRSVAIRHAVRRVVHLYKLMDGKKKVKKSS
jgi:hypothetical protein